MTLQEFFDRIAENPLWILAFFLLLPLTAFLVGQVSKEEGHESPWSYIYSTLIYLACVPGVFAVTLTAYFFLFERRSIMQTHLLTQVLPVLSMVATLLLIRRYVDLGRIPGFDRITGLISVIFVVLVIMWVLDKTRIWVVSFLPFWQGALIFVGLFLLLRWGWVRMSRRTG